MRVLGCYCFESRASERYSYVVALVLDILAGGIGVRLDVIQTGYTQLRKQIARKCQVVQNASTW